MKKCEHGVEQGRYCAPCAKILAKKPAYVYSRDEVIGLNPIRAAQGHKPLTGKETWEMQDGKRTGRVLGPDGKSL